MPQAVSNVSPVSPPAPNLSAPSRSTAGSSFRDALEQASIGDTSPSPSAPADQAPKPQSSKAARPSKTSEKKAIKKNDAAPTDKKARTASQLSADEKRTEVQGESDLQNPTGGRKEKSAGQDNEATKPPQPAAQQSPDPSASVLQPAAIVELQQNPQTAKPQKSGKTSDAPSQTSQPVAKPQARPTAKSVDPHAAATQDEANNKEATDDSSDPNEQSDVSATTDRRASQTSVVPTAANEPKKGKPQLAIQANSAQGSKSDLSGNSDANSATVAAQAATASSNAVVPGDSEPDVAAASPRPVPRIDDDLLLRAAVSQQSSAASPPSTASTLAARAGAPDPALPAEAQFAEANHATIVTAIHGQLLPAGGTMQLRLDPPELGAMHVRVEMRDGVMTASFETTSDQATKLLSHSLSDLKSALEAQGVTVDKLHVRQSPAGRSSSGDGEPSSDDQSQRHSDQQEQQRQEMLRRMWKRLMKTQDRLDLVA